jgi:hypothetical protein
MKKYMVNVIVGCNIVKRIVVDRREVAQMIADTIADDVTEVIIREVA